MRLNDRQAKLGHVHPKLSFRKNDDGTTAVEFALVAMPFFFLIFMLVGIAMYYFMFNSLEKGMDQTSRLVRTGQAQKSAMTVNQFKQAICDSAGSWVKCNKVQIFVQKFADWNSVAPQACVNSDGSVAVNTASGSDPISTYSGTQSEIVIVTSCYKWEFSRDIPLIKLGNMADGSMMVQTATAFRTEPYAE